MPRKTEKQPYHPQDFPHLSQYHDWHDYLHDRLSPIFWNNYLQLLRCYPNQLPLPKTGKEKTYHYQAFDQVRKQQGNYSKSISLPYVFKANEGHILVLPRLEKTNAQYRFFIDEDIYDLVKLRIEKNLHTVLTSIQLLRLFVFDQQMGVQTSLYRFERNILALLNIDTLTTEQLITILRPTTSSTIYSGLGRLNRFLLQTKDDLCLELHTERKRVQKTYQLRRVFKGYS